MQQRRGTQPLQHHHRQSGEQQQPEKKEMIVDSKLSFATVWQKLREVDLALQSLQATESTEHFFIGRDDPDDQFCVEPETDLCWDLVDDQNKHGLQHEQCEQSKPENKEHEQTTESDKEVCEQHNTRLDEADFLDETSLAEAHESKAANTSGGEPSSELGTNQGESEEKKGENHDTTSQANTDFAAEKLEPTPLAPTAGTSGEQSQIDEGLQVGGSKFVGHRPKEKPKDPTQGESDYHDLITDGIMHEFAKRHADARPELLQAMRVRLLMELKAMD